MGRNTKGSRRERELTNRLHEQGWRVMRAPSSGSATDRDLPDVLAGNGERFYAIEAKASSKKPIYIGKGEIESLRYFSEGFGATPLVGARFDRCAWYFFHPSELHETEKSLRVKRITATGEGVPMEELATHTWE